MMLDVPFVENDGDQNRCMQACMLSAIRKFIADTKLDLDELDRMTGRRSGEMTWTPQIAAALHEIGLRVRYFSKEPIDEDSIAQSLKRYEGTYETNEEALFWSAKKCGDYGIFEQRLLTEGDIEGFIREKDVVIVIVDANKLYDSDGGYYGHSVVLTGFDDENFCYHENGPRGVGPDKSVPKKKLAEAWSAAGTNNDVVVAFGRR